MTLKIGYAQQVITPSLQSVIFLAGFGRNRRATGVHDDLYARALGLECAGTRVVIVALDLIGLLHPYCQEMARQVEERIPGTDLLVACTHTHHGPDTIGLWGPDELTPGVDAAYMEWLQAAVVKTAVSALSVMQLAQLAHTEVTVSGVAKNARDPHIRDESLTCLQFCAEPAGTPLVTWLNYPCHPEVLWDQNTDITSDYLATMRQVVEAETGAPCLAHVGALGGMMTPDVAEHNFTEATAMGDTLAQAALGALSLSRPQSVRRMAFNKASFVIPLQNPLFQMAAAAGLLPAIADDHGLVHTEASLLQLNGMWLCGVPGELLPKLGLEFRNMMRDAGADETAVIGLAQDELGYILPVEDFTAPADYGDPDASYEESMSVSPQIAPALRRAMQQLIRHSTQGEN